MIRPRVLLIVSLAASMTAWALVGAVPFAALSVAQAAASCSIGFVGSVSSPLGTALDFNAVGGASGSDLWAVGDIPIGYYGESLTEHWDGTRWIRVQSPNEPQGLLTLNAVSGGATEDVWAVGATHYGHWTTAAMHWDGSVWTLVPTQDPAVYNYLADVVEITPSDVWAVGSAGRSGPNAQALAEHWDGSTWTAMAPPAPVSKETRLLGVSALSSTDVWATGFYTSSSRTKALFEHWDGTSWTFVPGPNLTRPSQLNAIVMTSPTDGWAAGKTGGGELIERWNGAAWDLFSASSDPPQLQLSAATPNDVWATGGQTEHWDGSSWTPVISPPIVAIDAVDASDAVGIAGDRIFRWSGSSWQGVSFIDGAPYSQHLTAIGAGTYTDLFGFSRAFSGGPLSAIGPKGDFVTDDDGPFIVGYYLDESKDEHAWIVGYPSPAKGELLGVSSLDGSNAWAVGFQPSGDTQQALAVHFDGSSWTAVPTPNLGVSNELRGVVAVSGDDVWAVGLQRDEAGATHTLTEHWDGSNWRVVPSSDGSGTKSILESAAATTADDVWAVGHHRASKGVLRTLTEHWDGTSWTIVKSPNSGPGSNSLVDAAATPGGGFLAVGSYAATRSQAGALILFYDGTAWSVASSQPPSPGLSQKLAAASPTGGAAGGSISPDGFASDYTMGQCTLSMTDDKFSQSGGTTQVGDPTFWYVDTADTGSHRLIDGSSLALFRSGPLTPGETWSFVPQSAGTYPVKDPVFPGTMNLRVGMRIPFPGVAGTPLTLVWAGSGARPGLVYDVKVQIPGSSKWIPVVTSATQGNGTYTPSEVGMYRFKARTRDPGSGDSSKWSTPQSVDVSPVS